jgi:hypothetical protein
MPNKKTDKFITKPYIHRILKLMESFRNIVKQNATPNVIMKRLTTNELATENNNRKAIPKINGMANLTNGACRKNSLEINIE